MPSAERASDQRPPAIFLMGPTATGKTALACALADRFPVELVSVDSALVYRGLDIGAAKPDASVLTRYPHALIDIRDPADPYSAALFREDALRAMEGIAARGSVPLLVGGTGLYFRALERGLSAMPEADPGIRDRLQAEAERHGWPALHMRLAALDPEAAARIRPNDAQRIQRALEAIELSGRRLSELHRSGEPSARLPYRVLKLALLPADRTHLRERVAARFDAMLAAGLLDEVRRLRARGDLGPDLPAMRAVGYRQAWQHLDGAFDAAEFRRQAVDATRQLAKRQTTWLRGELDARMVDPDWPGCNEALVDAIALFLGPEAGLSGPNAGDLRYHLNAGKRFAASPDQKAITMSKSQSLQDPFLNALRRERIPVAIYLVNGIKLQGVIESFDQFVVLLRNQVSQMVYKHAISTVVPSRAVKVASEEAAASNGKDEDAGPPAQD